MKKKIQNLITNNQIPKNYFKNSFVKKDKTKLNKIIRNISKDINNKKNTFHILSKKFILNLSTAKLKKFKKYKIVIIIGMGGSVLGAHAIYSLLEQKIKKNFIFIDNLNQPHIEKIKKKNKLKKKSIYYYF